MGFFGRTNMLQCILSLLFVDLWLHENLEAQQPDMCGLDQRVEAFRLFASYRQQDIRLAKKECEKRIEINDETSQQSPLAKTQPVSLPLAPSIVGSCRPPPESV
ncbi:hypothetical protein SODALDRAFT_376301 [Sodiomyces alkalinus F11]|uniref:Secreted protein n=1 Tax=Sodiomyces alkalinus (strain CBS 110278 / VKM F-3762 / F11) TaxID=1314773 RepID=A0A3N2Q175_SODAK|nr:hypothetical protein SODALDRAFT_376301 [Sodiomyces alkalinus F11]ROT40514.1 hypothetical protein SODALDRAFT_376301 [Sodiomyces alkalinus F11]